MISKEHIQIRDKGDHFKASTISEKGVWLERCAEFLKELEELEAPTFERIEEECKQWVGRGEGGIFAGRSCPNLAKENGLKEHDGSVWEEKRVKKKFVDSAKLWREALTLEDILEVQSLAKENDQELVYGDLPHYRRLLDMPKWTPDQWIRRYNLGLVQGVLLQAPIDGLAFARHQLDKFGIYSNTSNFLDCTIEY